MAQTNEPTVQKKQGSRKAVFIAIAVVLIVVCALAAFVFLSGVLQPRVVPKIVDVGLGVDDYGKTYRYFVTVRNDGASGDIKVFVEVRATRVGGRVEGYSTNTYFTQTQNQTVHLDSGGGTTLTFEFHSDYLAMSNINVARNVWTIAL